MGQNRTITITIDAAEAADLSAIAKSEGLTSAGLLARLAREYTAPVAAERAALAALRQAQRAGAERRLSILREYWDIRRDGTARDRLLARHGLARRTLIYWQLRYSGMGVAGLVDRRAERAGVAPTFPEFKAELIRTYRSGGWSMTIANCYRKACKTAQRRGWMIPSQKTAGRMLGSLKDVQKRFVGPSNRPVTSADEPATSRDVDPPAPARTRKARVPSR